MTKENKKLYFNSRFLVFLVNFTFFKLRKTALTPTAIDFLEMIQVSSFPTLKITDKVKDNAILLQSIRQSSDFKILKVFRICTGLKDQGYLPKGMIT